MLGRIGEAKSDGGGFANGENTCTHINEKKKQRQGFKPRFPYEPKRYGMESLVGYLSGNSLNHLRLHSEITDMGFHHFRGLGRVHLTF